MHCVINECRLQAQIKVRRICEDWLDMTSDDTTTDEQSSSLQSAVKLKMSQHLKCYTEFVDNTCDTSNGIMLCTHSVLPLMSIHDFADYNYNNLQ